MNCDVTERNAVARLFKTAADLGTSAAVIHTAGVSPSMGDAEYVMRTNALGTLNVNEVFYGTAAEGLAIVNVASMAAHMLPNNSSRRPRFPSALPDDAAFVTAMLPVCDIAPSDARSGIAYAVSKSFVRWYSTSQAERFNGRGPARRLRLPGVDRHRDGQARGEGRSRGDGRRRRGPAVGQARRNGRTPRLLCEPRAGDLTGTDILNDGGVIASMRQRGRAGRRWRLSRSDHIHPDGEGRRHRWRVSPAGSSRSARS